MLLGYTSFTVHSFRLRCPKQQPEERKGRGVGWGGGGGLAGECGRGCVRVRVPPPTSLRLFEGLNRRACEAGWLRLDVGETLLQRPGFWVASV